MDVGTRESRLLKSGVLYALTVPDRTTKYTTAAPRRPAFTTPCWSGCVCHTMIKKHMTTTCLTHLPVLVRRWILQNILKDADERGGAVLNDLRVIVLVIQQLSGKVGAQRGAENHEGEQ